MPKHQQPNLPLFDLEKAEDQIESHRKIVDYDIKEYPIEVIVNKYLGKNDYGADSPEFFIPDYQREHTWDERRKSKFIESVLIGLPIPFLFLAEINNEEGQLEIVDGSQRIRTLTEFINGKLVLTDLEKLKLLNGSTFDQLPLARQRKFNRTTIRIIALSEEADEETRRDLFERINTGSDPLRHMEQRRGIMRGPFIDFLEECAKHPLLIKLAPLSAPNIKRREREEFVLRFFAYSTDYLNFNKSVKEFLDDYVKKQQDNDTPLFDKDALKTKFEKMLNFVDANFDNGFRKPNHNTTPRIRYEAISVGVSLALDKNPNLTPKSTNEWIHSDEFLELTTSDASNSRPKVISRIEYVRDKLLEQ